jgi:ABC-type nitrate/sulfonate/bicarbonate transport system ATPase subunit
MVANMKVKKMDGSQDRHRCAQSARGGVALVGRRVLLLSDRIAMMTSVPGAKVGAILEIDLPRPRDRHRLPANDRCRAVRDSMLAFLQAA